VPAFVQPGGTNNNPDPFNRFGFPVTIGGTLHRMFARHNLIAGDGSLATYTLFVNGVPTFLAVSVPTGAIAQASNLIDSVVVVAGDVLSLSVDSTSLGPNQVEAKISVQFDP